MTFPYQHKNTLHYKSIADGSEHNYTKLTITVNHTYLNSANTCRYSADGTPLILKAFFESANSALNFQFHFKQRPGQLTPLEEEYDRRVIGKRVNTKVRFSRKNLNPLKET